MFTLIETISNEFVHGQIPIWIEHSNDVRLWNTEASDIKKFSTTVSASMQPHSWIAPHLKFKVKFLWFFFNIIFVQMSTFLNIMNLTLAKNHFEK